MKNVPTINKHGGKRAGAGRKKGRETTRIRVPVCMLDAIKQLMVEIDAQESKPKIVESCAQESKVESCAQESKPKKVESRAQKSKRSTRKRSVKVQPKPKMAFKILGSKDRPQPLYQVIYESLSGVDKDEVDKAIKDGRVYLT